MAIGKVVDTAKINERVQKQITSGSRDLKGLVFKWLMFSALGFSMLILLVLVVDVVSGGWDPLSSRFGDFLSSSNRTRPEVAGVFQALRGTFWIGVFVVMFSFPLGIGCALYLEEYASDNRFTRFIDTNIRNLAGVPSVVYGILGLTMFVKVADGFFPGSATAHQGNTLAAGGLILAVLVLPIVIITSAEAIRAVPRSLREGAYGVGATRWEVVRTQVLPYAAPGILTGTLLSLARALGEAAPLILVGAVQGRLGANTGFLNPSQVGEKFTALPILITNWAGKPGDAWAANTAAAIVVLLLVVLFANSAAILLRNRFEKRRGS